MRPIVDRLQEDNEQLIAFRYLNAADGSEGQQAFEQLALPGHPGVVIFDQSGNEVYRAFGVVEEDTLREALISTLSNAQ